MKYEATIDFEVKDGSIRLNRLIADQKIVIHGWGLIGRTWDGEVVSQSGSAGTVTGRPRRR